jgi:hypothetical protein
LFLFDTTAVMVVATTMARAHSRLKRLREISVEMRAALAEDGE